MTLSLSFTLVIFLCSTCMRSSCLSCRYLKTTRGINDREWERGRERKSSPLAHTFTRRGNHLATAIILNRRVGFIFDGRGSSKYIEIEIVAKSRQGVTRCQTSLKCRNTWTFCMWNLLVISQFTLGFIQNFMQIPRINILPIFIWNITIKSKGKTLEIKPLALSEIRIPFTSLIWKVQKVIPNI